MLGPPDLVALLRGDARSHATKGVTHTGNLKGSDMTFTIEAGKRYNIRDGGVSGVLINRNSRYYPFEDANKNTYTKNGEIVGDEVKSYGDLISEYIEPASTTEPQDEYGPWIGWNGGECPVDGGVKVQLQRRCDTRIEAENNPVSYADNRVWDYGRGVLCKNRIIAYRVKLSPPSIESAAYVNEDGVVVTFKPVKSPAREIIITVKGDNISARRAAC